MVDDECISTISGKCVTFHKCFSEEHEDCLKDVRFLYEKGNEQLTFLKKQNCPPGFWDSEFMLGGMKFLRKA